MRTFVLASLVAAVLVPAGFAAAGSSATGSGHFVFASTKESISFNAAEGRLQLEPLVTHVLPAEQAPDAFRLLDEHPEDAVQVVLDFRPH